MVAIRQARPGDAEAACVAVRRSITECCAEDHGGDPHKLDAWLANKTPDRVRSWFQDRSYAVVAERDGSIVGTGLLLENGTIALFYLLPEARRLGLGTGMLQSLEAEARRRGLPRIELESTRTAYAFYRRHGYEDTGTVAIAYGMRAPRLQKLINSRPGGAGPALSGTG